ncbi:MAG: anaerobic nitric oxide reductase transcription regulator [Osedax symbiont Rs2]|nr:MAG: anaerobic nitric oxide reductase transcription regulator [Osedax symbiont Rs2]
MNDISSTALIELAIDLTSSLAAVERYDRLLDTVRKTIPCEAVALLLLSGDRLKPLALQGLSRDTLGRRFLLSEHPRMAQICNSKTVVRFASDSELPDPYDGLLVDREGDLPVHACMGLPLYFADQLLGILTLDSLTANVFDKIPRWTLEMVAAIAAATLNPALMIEQLQQRGSHNQQLMVDLTEQARCRDGGEIIGESPAIQQLQQEIAIAASADVTVLVCGETGVGKELVVRNLHQKSALRSGPLVSVNCAALAENLIESELFGHVKGAFTGAEQGRAGKFLLADNGTLFLDEIGELPLAAQSKLLRVLQNSEIQPLGQDTVMHVKVRIIAATNRDLLHEVQRGNFRADLYHRLSVYPISVPSLRERGEDVALLAGCFLEQNRRKIGLKQLKIDTAALTALSLYDWPGNVRELEHVISRSALKARARSASTNLVVIERQDCGILSSDKAPSDAKVFSTGPTTQRQPVTVDMPLREATDDFQRQMIVQALEDSNGNWAQAARVLKIDRANLARIGKRLSIKQIKLLLD